MRKPAPSRAAQHGLAARAVPLALDAHVRVVAEGGDHRRLHGRGRHQSEVLAHREQLADHVAASRDESGAVAGQVGLLAERRHRERQATAVADDATVQDAGRRLVLCSLDLGPVELGVALVVRDHRAELARAPDGAGQELDAVHPAVGVRRGCSARPGGSRRASRRARRRRAPSHRRRPHRPRSSGRRGWGSRPRRRAAARGGSAAGRRAPSIRWSAGRWRPRGRPRAGVRTRRRSPRAGPGIPRSPDSRAHRRRRAGRRAPHPGSHRPATRRTGRRCPSGCARARSPYGASASQGKSGSSRAIVGVGSRGQCVCGGTAATIGWSPATTPTLAAPPGEPIPTSSKNSTLAL